MLELDLAQLERQNRVRIDEQVPPDDPLWNGTEVRLRGPLRVELEAQRAGSDVVVRGHVTGSVEVECRRCLVEVVVGVEADVSLLLRPGLDRVEAERGEVYGFSERARVIDLSEPVREHVLLAAPRYEICREACRGMCARCGANLNEGACDCTASEQDERWAPLRKLRLD